MVVCLEPELEPEMEPELEPEPLAKVRFPIPAEPSERADSERVPFRSAGTRYSVQKNEQFVHMKRNHILPSSRNSAGI